MIMIFLFDELCFQILSVGHFKHESGLFQIKKRPFAALSLRICGTARFELDGQKFVSMPGDVLFIPSDTDYTVDYSVSESIVLHLTDCNYTHAENLSFHAEVFLRKRFEQLLEAWRKNQSVFRLKAEVYSLLCDMSTLAKPRSDAHLNDCLAYLEEHFCSASLRLNDLCHAGSFSESSLRRAFYQSFGLSPKQYILEKRLRFAASLLAEERMSVKEAAFATGFTDEKYFSRCMKKKYGVPPSAFGKM